MTKLGSSESTYGQFGPKGRAFMCASCLVCAVCLIWVFVKSRGEIEPSKNLEHPETLRFHLGHQATSAMAKGRQEKIVADYTRMRRWYPVLVQLSLMASFVGTVCAIVSAVRFAFPSRTTPPQAIKNIAKDRDKSETGV